MTNLVVLRGRLARPAALRSLPSGDRLVALEVSMPAEGRRTETAPVVWPDPPATAVALDVDQEVVVVGRVRRRFFRAGGATASRTEVVAEVVVPVSQARRVHAALARAAGVVGEAGRGGPAAARPR